MRWPWRANSAELRHQNPPLPANDPFTTAAPWMPAPGGPIQEAGLAGGALISVGCSDPGCDWGRNARFYAPHKALSAFIGHANTNHHPLMYISRSQEAHDARS